MGREVLRVISREHSMIVQRENLREQFFIWLSRVVMAAVTPGALGGAIFLASKGDVSHAMLVGSGGVFVDTAALAAHWAAKNIIKSEPKTNKAKT